MTGELPELPVPEPNSYREASIPRPGDHFGGLGCWTRCNEPVVGMKDGMHVCLTHLEATP
jgi:hypothetical protein